MSLLLAILNTASEGFKPFGGGGVFIFKLYERRKRATSPAQPRIVEYEGERHSGMSEVLGSQDAHPIPRGKNILPVPKVPKIKSAVRKLPSQNHSINLMSFALGGVAQQNAERLMQAEIAIQERRIYNDAVAIMLLLAS